MVFYVQTETNIVIIFERPKTLKHLDIKRFTICLVLLVFFAIPVVLTIKKNSDTPISKSGFYFNTIIKITLYASSDEALLEDCFALADTYEKMFSTTIPDSDISRINAAKGEPVEVSPETIELLEKGLYYGKLSEGGFDITIGKLSSLWDFGNNEGIVPASADIDEALTTLDYNSVFILGNTVCLKNPDTRIDLGGIAKGYIADRMKEYLNENGVTEGTINLGGNVLCLGAKATGDAYKIGIQKPFDETGTPLAVVEVTDQTVVSSGVYERYFKIDDTLYHHILDPKTGYPYENSLLGVTIICPQSVDGDGLSTTCFALGLEKGMELIESIPDTEAIFITEGNEIHMTSGVGTKVPFYSYE